MTPEESALHAHLEDKLSRLALADLAEERGEDVLAAGLRWMAREGKWPDRACTRRWDWWTHDARDIHHNCRPAHARIDDHLYYQMPHVAMFNTRREAEDGLIRLLALAETVPQ